VTELDRQQYGGELLMCRFRIALPHGDVRMSLCQRSPLVASANASSFNWASAAMDVELSARSRAGAVECWRLAEDSSLGG
jgi:hypothetical protein